MPELGERKVFMGQTYEYMALTSAFMDSSVQRKNGTLQTLQQVTGVAADRIAAANGVSWTIIAVNNWVIASGGVWLPHATGTPRVPGSPTGGWAVFIIGNRVFVPVEAASVSPTLPVPSPTPDVPAPTPTPPKEGMGTGMMVALGIGLVAVVGAIAASQRRRKG